LLTHFFKADTDDFRTFDDHPIDPLALDDPGKNGVGANSAGAKFDGRRFDEAYDRPLVAARACDDDD
jgi:hypothetical protein